MRFEAFEEIISALKESKLPGEVAQIQMAPPFREALIKRQKLEAKPFRKAAVLALFYPNKYNETMLVFIVRKSYDGVHSGQIGFPGGKPEPVDDNLSQTAIRETWEEIGVSRSSIQLLKPLTELYIPPSNFNVSPFLGMTNFRPIFTLQTSEVQSIIEVPLSDILNKKNRIETSVKTSYGPTVRVPSFEFQGNIIWGATAMILMEIVELFQQILKK